MHARPLILALTCLACAAACDESTPSGPSAPLNQQFTLAPGQTTSIENTPVSVQFVRVSHDSRCPRDAACVQAGHALVLVRVTGGGSSEYELHTADESLAAVTHAGLRIELASLQPYPISSRMIGADEYRATIRVRRP